MRFQRELLKGTTETLVLAVLRNAPAHGYELVGRLRQRSEGIFELGEGTLYPLLYKLEDTGLISGKWEAAPSNAAGQSARTLSPFASSSRRPT